MDGRTINGKVQSTAGGVGRNVADCMARLGANPFFISNVGAQEYAETLLSKMDHMQYHDESNEYLNRIITGDETWVDNCDKLALFPGGRFL